MGLSKQFAKQFREVYLEGKWVANTNLKEQLSQTTWEEANTKIGHLNTIAALAFHINYYVVGVTQVLEGGSLDIRDKFSFDAPAIESKEDWDNLRSKMWKDGEKFASQEELISDEKLKEGFVKPEYGDYQRNILVIIEHTYYHLGQISLIKKML